MKSRIRLNYPEMRAMDIGFSNALTPMGCIIRGVTAGWGGIFNREIPNHALFATDNHSQFFATEECPNGLKENSLEKYRGSLNRLVEWWRWDGFDDPKLRDEVQCYLAEIRRKSDERSKYDWGGVIRQTKYLWRILPWIKADPERDFCSENVFRVMKKFGGLKEYPLVWDTKPPDPYKLASWFRTQADFHNITDQILLPLRSSSEILHAQALRS